MRNFALADSSGSNWNTMQCPRTSSHAPLRYVLTWVALLLFAANTWGQGKGTFRVDAPQIDAEAVEFTYFAPYPGMTKVLLYDAKGQLIWRGQYVDPEGSNKLRLRSSYLESGMAYTFHFEYKLERVKWDVVGP
jgi:hypothetical protein